MLIIILVVIVVLLYMYLPCRTIEHAGEAEAENFTPTREMAQDVVANIDTIGKSLDSAKKKMPWMNVVSYEGVRHLMSGGNPTVEQIMSVL